MTEIGKALKVIFDKLSDFFDIFDLSFFVSGVATTASILLWLHWRDINLDYGNKSSLFVILLILICYINGLVSFALGRWIRMGNLVDKVKINIFKKENRFKTFDDRIIHIISAHGLESHDYFKSYLSRTKYRGTWRLYVLLWAEMRQDEKYSTSLSFLKRYWVMAATYDGLSISVFVSLLLVLESYLGIIGGQAIMNPTIGVPINVLQVFMFIACLREANRYVEYQVEEVIASKAQSIIDESKSK